MNNLKLCVIVIVVIVIGLLLWYVNYGNPSNNLVNSYLKVSGYTNDKNAQDVIKAGKKIKNPSNLENFRIGNVNLNNIHDTIEAGENYMKTLTGILDNPLEHENLFILDKIQEDYDRFGQNLTSYNINNIVPQTRNYVTDNIINAVGSTSHNQPKQTQKINTYRQKENWTIDTQNVHDTKINKSLREHFNKIKNYNQKEFGNLNHENVNETLQNIRNYIENSNNENASNAYKVLDNSKNGLSVMNVGTEQEVLVEIWRRINSVSNKSNVNSLKTSYLESLNSCVENDNLVCTQGRVTRMVQCLSHMDSDNKLGLMQTIEALRNSVYENASKILKSNLKNLNKENLNTYNDGGHNDEIKKIEDQAREEIAQMVRNTD